MCHMDGNPSATPVGQNRCPDLSRWKITLGIFVSVIAVLACGGTSSNVIQDGSLDPVNQSISGLPLFVAPSSTPMPTNTQPPTAVQPTAYSPPSGYATYTPVPGLSQDCDWVLDPDTGLYEWVCTGPYVTNTPYPGGLYTTPGAVSPGASSTPRPTYTPYPSATPCVSSFTYYLGEEVFTDPSPSNLTLGISLGNVRTFTSVQRPDRQIVAWTVDIRNLGQIAYLLFAPFQIFVGGIDGHFVTSFSSEEPAEELGMDLHDAVLDGYWISAGEDVRFDMFAYTNVGEPSALAYILDPYANGYDGTIAGGNVAYWESGERGACAGKIGPDYTPQPNLTPQPTPTPTYTPSFGN